VSGVAHGASCIHRESVSRVCRWPNAYALRTLQPYIWNRTRAEAEPLGCHRRAPLRHTRRGGAHADIVVTMLEDGDVVESVLLSELRAGAPTGSLLIDMSSIQPAQARSHGAAGRAGRSLSGRAGIRRNPGCASRQPGHHGRGRCAGIRTRPGTSCALR
jgi:hypothetical protein